MRREPETTPKPIHVLGVVSGFEVNGAILQLLHSLENLDRSRVTFTLCALGAGGPLQDRFRSLGFPILLPRRRMRFDPLLLVELTRIIKAGRFDVIYALKHTGALWGRAAATLAGHPAVVTHEHGSPLELVPRVVLAIDGFQTRRSRLVLTNSEHTKGRIVEYLGVSPDRIRVLYNSLSYPHPARTRGDSPPSNPVIGFTGRLIPFKSADLFVRALPAVFRECPGATARIVGEGPLKPKLRELAETLGVSERVEFLPWFADATEALAIFDVLVVPSAYEAFGNVLLEAALVDLPAVAARVGGMPEIVERTRHAVLVDPTLSPTGEDRGWASMSTLEPELRKFPVVDPADLAREVVRTLKEPGLYQSLSQGARDRALEAFPMEKHVREFQTALLEAAAAGSSSGKRDMREA